jgi:hypothetical protein
MPANSSLDLVSLDFDTQKASLKEFLRAQDQLRDYDFEGASINVLLDILTYNTQKNTFFLNMNFAESHLDSAQLLESVVSHAKSLNYTPRSVRSASANVRVDFTATGESQPYIIQKGSSFSSLVKNESFIFSIPESLIVSSPNSNFTFTTTVYEGSYLKNTYIFQNSADIQRFKITNRNVDTTSITVTVYEDGSLVGQAYLLRTTLLDIDEDSKVFFLQAAENGFYEIVFGDNVSGRQPKAGSTIVIDYRVSQGPKANGARNFVLNFDPTGAVSELSNTPTVNTISTAMNGANAESLESIKYYAPRHFQAQERTIVPEDYETALIEEFPEINAVSAFGGEDADPPQFGKVFIAVDLIDVDGLPESKKDQYYEFVRSRSPVKPVFIEPKFTYLDVNSVVRYNVNVTTNTPTSIKTLVINTINEYNTEFLDDFGVQFRHSPFTRLIDDTDASIVSNVTNIRIYKKLTPQLTTLLNFPMNFGVALLNDLPELPTRHPIGEQHIISSTSFMYNGISVFVEDDGDGGIRLMRRDGGNDVKVVDVGTVDYDTGYLNFENFFVDSYVGSAIHVYARPRDKDIILPKDTIAQIEADAITVTVETLKQ